MPKKTKIDVEILVEVIKKYNIFNEDNHLKGPTDDCWSSIEKYLNYLINTKYIYTIVLLFYTIDIKIIKCRGG